MAACRALLAILLLSTAAAARPPARPHVYDLIVGGEQEYTVAPGDSLWSITGRFPMNVSLLQSLNALSDPDHLRPGTRLRVSDRHIVPRRDGDGIVIDLADRTLFWFQKGALVARYPVGIGRIDWATPPGRYRIVGRREDPVWHVPPSVQEEMRARGETVVPVVAAGPENPLGKYWIQLSAPGYGLHGTNAPASVGKYASHGCMRFLPAHIERLYREARDGTPVEVVYEPVKLARDAIGAVYLEVHRDVYRGNRTELVRVLDQIAAAGLTDAVDVTRVATAVERAWGVPEDVTLPRVTPPAPPGAPVESAISPAPAAGP